MVNVPTQDPPAILSRTTKCSQTPIWETLLYTNDCTSKDPSVKLLKFADDTTLIGLIQDGDESAYRLEIKELTVWCSLNNLELNTLKTGEMIMNFRRALDPHIQHTPSLMCYRLIDATELWAPERPDTETVSSLRQSTHEHLTLNVEHTTHTIIYNLCITHTYYFFHHTYISICKCHTSTYIIVYIIYCVCAFS